MSAPDEARRCLDLPSKDGGDRIYFNGSNIAVEDAGAQYGTTAAKTAPKQREALRIGSRKIQKLC